MAIRFQHSRITIFSMLKWRPHHQNNLQKVLQKCASQTNHRPEYGRELRTFPLLAFITSFVWILFVTCCSFLLFCYCSRFVVLDEFIITAPSDATKLFLMMFRIFCDLEFIIYFVNVINVFRFSFEYANEPLDIVVEWFLGKFDLVSYLVEVSQTEHWFLILLFQFFTVS